jgi:transposase
MLKWRLSRSVPADTAALGQILLAVTDIYRQIGDRFDELIPAEDVFSPMYSHKGMGAVSPLLLALVTILQVMEKLPDRVAAGYVVTRLDWKYALHLPLGYLGFHFTDLHAFRQRLLEHGQERLVFDQVVAKLKAMGLIKERGKVRTDATHVVALINRLSQLELVRESIRVVLDAVGDVAPVWVSETVPEAFTETYGQRRNDYRLSNAQIAKQLLEAGRDGFWFLAQIERSAPAEARMLSEVGVLRAVLQQQYPQGPQSGPVKDRPAGRGVIETPHDPEARGSKKRHKSWVGYKEHITETCDEKLPSLIVDVEVTDATVGDNDELPEIQGRLAEREMQPGKQLVDQAYMSGPNLARSTEEGTDLVGRPEQDHGAPEGYRQANFQTDEEKKEAVCPAGHKNVVWSEKLIGDGERCRVEIRFASKTCQECRAFGVCTKSTQGRSLALNPYRDLLEPCRARAKTEEFKQEFKLRSQIEGSISELVRGYGARHARYRGRAKNRLQACFTATAANLKRTIRWSLQRERCAAEAVAA